MIERTGLKVGVTGISIRSAIGCDEEEVAKNLQRRWCGMRRKHRFSRYTPAILGELAHGRIYAASRYALMEDDRLTRLVLDMVDDLAERRQLFRRYKPQDIGFFFGTTTAGYEAASRMRRQFFEAPSALSLSSFLGRDDELGVLARTVRTRFPIKGVGATISTACSSGAMALAEAAAAIRMGLVQAAVVGGADILNRITINGFNSLQVLDMDPCNPFSSERKGMNLAEGGALFLLEKGEDSDPVAFLAGSGISCDGYHMSAPQPQGKGMELAMRRALKAAGITPDEIAYINAHGTGTLPNDSAEKLAINRVFGEQVAMGSTKRFHGHMLAGAGAFEAAIAIYALRGRIDVGRIIDAGKAPEKMPAVLSNAFGFGGSNVSLVFK